jgi:hypothetical protein
MSPSRHGALITHSGRHTCQHEECLRAQAAKQTEAGVMVVVWFTSQVDRLSDTMDALSPQG